MHFEEKYNQWLACELNPTEDSSLEDRLAFLLLEVLDGLGALTSKHELADAVGADNLSLAEVTLAELKTAK